MTLLQYIIFVLVCSAPLLASAQLNEKLLIRTDKGSYHAGENIWMSIDILDAKSNTHSSVSKIVYVELLSSDDKPVLQAKIGMNEAAGDGALILPANLRPGVYMLRGYTNWMKNYDAANYFIKPITVYNIPLSGTKIGKLKQHVNNAEDIKINARPDKNVYGKKDKISVEISGSDPNIKNVSVSVFRIDPLQDYEGMPGLSAEKSSGPETKNAFVPEIYGHIISGTVTNVRNGNAAGGVNCYLSVIGPVNRFYTGTSDSSGNVFFELKDVYDDNKIVLQTSDTNYRVELNNSFSTKYAPVSGLQIDSLKVDTTILDEHIVSAQVQSVYAAYRKNMFTNARTDTVPFYGKAEYIYEVDEYVKFSSVEDIFREYVRPVQMYRREKLIEPFIFRESDRTLFSNNPMVFIDQVPVFNMAQLMTLNPAKIERIDVINKTYYLQKQNYDGVIAVFTKTKDPADYLTRNAAIYDFKGIQSPANFYSPIYATAAQRNSRLPDFRNVLYWAPRLTIKDSPTIEFYSSDLEGEYAVVIEGITFNGITGRKIITFKVQ